MRSVPVAQEYQDSHSWWDPIWQLSNTGIREDRYILFVLSQLRIFDLHIGFLEFPDNFVSCLSIFDSGSTSCHWQLQLLIAHFWSRLVRDPSWVFQWVALAWTCSPRWAWSCFMKTSLFYVKPLQSTSNVVQLAHIDAAMVMLHISTRGPVLVLYISSKVESDHHRFGDILVKPCTSCTQGIINIQCHNASMPTSFPFFM